VLGGGLAPTDVPDYYAILGVPSAATAEQIERAYKLLARMSHPDAFPQDAQAQAWANQRMKDINEAYEVLKDPAKRAAYDLKYRAWQASEAERAKQQQYRKPEEPRVRCPLCKGEGKAPCLVCDGRGDADCPGCAGKRITVCPVCHGAGSLSQAEYSELMAELERAEQRAKEAKARQQAEADVQRQAEAAREFKHTDYRNVAAAAGVILVGVLLLRVATSHPTSQPASPPPAASAPATSVLPVAVPPPQPSEQRVTASMIVDQGGDFHGYQNWENITVARRLIDWGIGPFADDKQNVWATIRLKGQWNAFETKIGIADQIATESAWAAGAYAYFVVFLDGKEVYRSPKITPGELVPVKLEVSGVDALQLMISYHHMRAALGAGALFAEPKLIRSP